MMLHRRTCTACVTGLRAHKLPWGYNEDAPAALRLKGELEQVVQDLQLLGYTDFICGMATGADTFFAEAVLNQRGRLIAAIPYPHQERGWPEDYQARYRDLLSLACEQHLISEDYTPDAPLRRNRWMVDRASAVVVVWDGQPGGTASTVRYAKKWDKNLIYVQL